MVGFFSTRDNGAHNGHSHSGSNFTEIIANNSVDAASQNSENNNTALGILVLYTFLFGVCSLHYVHLIVFDCEYNDLWST